jgi:hypothetical protein
MVRLFLLVIALAVGVMCFCSVCQFSGNARMSQHRQQVDDLAQGKW